MLLTAVASAAATINGIVVDVADTTELVGATVKLMRATRDSAFVAGTATDANGVFNLSGVARGRYKIKFSYLGYADVVRYVTVGADGRDVNLGAVGLQSSSVRLKEAVVVGVKTPITVKEDTVEYNADSYKTQSNAVVEDLLKRLPGVEVGSDGKITANGKSVTKVLIDGKEFFSDDPTVASKNIPANMVDKLQVIDRKSDLARLTGVDDGEDETVINLTVKKGMNNGWFGTATAGYGTDKRYTGNLMANYFSGGNQLTIMGGGNNTNNLGFTDGGASRFQRFGSSNGITTSQNVGVNFNVGTRDSERLRVGGDIMYSHSDRDSHSSRDRTYLYTDSVSYYNASSQSRDKGHNVRGDFRIKWEVDSQNTIEFRPNFSFNFNNSVKSDSSVTRMADAALTPVNRSISSESSHGRSYEAAGQLVWNHKVKSHPGRSFSAQVRYNYSNVDEDGSTYTRNNYYLKADADETIDQIYDNHRLTNGVNGRLTWTEPLGNVRKARFFTIAYSANYKVSKATKTVYDITRSESAPIAPDMSGVILDLLRDRNFTDYVAGYYGSYALTDGVLLSQIVASELGPEIDRTFNERLSNDFRNRYFNQSMDFGFRQVRKEYNLNVGFTVQSAMSSSTDLINSARNIPSHWVWSVAPYARLRYKFSKTRNLAVDYRMRSSQPSLTQLQPVADESNPLNIVVGNPDLKPTFTHRMNVRYSDFNQLAQRSVMAMVNVNYEQNSIVRTEITDPTTGGRTTTYANVNGVWNAMGMNMLSFPFTASKTFFFTNHISARYSQTIGYTNSLKNKSGTFSVSEAPGLAFRNGVFDIELRPRYSYQLTHNSVQTSSNREIHTYGGQFNANYSAPFGLILSSDLSYSATSGYAAGYNTRQWLWNASVGFQFLRNKTASVQLSVYDILNQRKSVSRNVTASYIEDVAYNSLARYGMLSFTYRFTTFKKGEEPKDSRRDGPRGPRGGGGRPPMGPPPGGRF